MKTFNDKNHYEVLRISFNAQASEIRRAYREALDIYEENSLVTYELFSEAQRKDLLQAIDEAYHTLINAEKRTEYNQMLIDTGQADDLSFYNNPSSQAAEPRPDQAPTPTPTPIKHRDIRTWVQQKSQQIDIRRTIEEIIVKDMISGQDLKRLREAFDISHAEIFEITRITTTVLTMIEENRYEELPADIYLKGFLKSYAEILQIDAQRIIAGYLKHKSLATAP